MAMSHKDWEPPHSRIWLVEINIKRGLDFPIYLNVWKRFCESMKESRAIENIPAHELDVLLSKFFIPVQKENGTEYKPSTLSCFQQCFQRYFLVWPYIMNFLLTELGQSVWENLDLGRWYSPHCIQSVLATSVKILPYRPPAQLLRKCSITMEFQLMPSPVLGFNQGKIAVPYPHCTLQVQVLQPLRVFLNDYWKCMQQHFGLKIFVPFCSHIW